MTFVFSEKPIRIAGGEGVSLYDDEGNEYLDAGASYACTPIGHCHPAVVDAVQRQASELLFVQGSYPVDARDDALDALRAVAPDGLTNVWTCNSGTEANEAALKFARSATGCSKIVATTRAFHGRTLGALSATHKPAYREAFEPLVPGVEFVEYGDSDALEAAVDDETAAVIVEPIQGEGGINPAPEGYLASAREATEEAGAALVFDEIQTGLGRTGTFWASEGVVPDVLTTAKGLASGLPMGAALCADWIAEDAGSHGSTFAGGPVVAAAAEATLSTIVDEGLAANAADVGTHLRESLSRVGPVTEVRGRGLMLGIETRQPAGRVLPKLALSENVLALPASRRVVRLLPPLTLDHEDADGIVAAVASALGVEVET